MASARGKEGSEAPVAAGTISNLLLSVNNTKINTSDPIVYFLISLCWCISFQQKILLMLAHTMEKLQQRSPCTPNKLTQTPIHSPTRHLRPHLSPPKPINGHSPLNPTHNPLTTTSPIHRQYAQVGTETRGAQQAEHIQQSYHLPIPVPLHLMKAKSEVLNIPLSRETSTQQTWRAKIQGAMKRQLLIETERRAVSPFEVAQIETQRRSISSRNDTEIFHYQRYISNLKQQLSQSFSDKLSLELKLGKANQLNKQLQFEIRVLKKQMQPQVLSKDKSYSSLQNDTIIQLLNEHQETKKIIERLMGDNEYLLRRNQELAREKPKGNKENEEFQKLKQQVMKVENEKFELFERVQSLASELEKERNRKQLYMEHTEIAADVSEKYEEAKLEIVNLKQEVEVLKHHIYMIRDSGVGDHSKKQVQMQEEVVKMRREIQQYAMAVERKGQEIITLNEQLSFMSSKLKEALGELTNFSQAFQIEKAGLIKEFETHKRTSSEQIASLKSELAKQMARQPISIAGNVIYIQASDLKQTKTRISGGYEVVILGQKPAVPVVTSVRTISE